MSRLARLATSIPVRTDSAEHIEAGVEASLSWRHEDGVAMVHCSASCTFDEIRAAL